MHTAHGGSAAIAAQSVSPCCCPRAGLVGPPRSFLCVLQTEGPFWAQPRQEWSRGELGGTVTLGAPALAPPVSLP